jgi:acetoin utilization deacetylase AcuC-like enzyme
MGWARTTTRSSIGCTRRAVGSLLAAREIAEGRADRAVNIAGGLHHAMRDHASGFCVYNDCAVAISWLLDHGFERIAYVDVDVHHGDGVQAAFYHDPRVLTISLHQHPLTLWPGTGWPGEYGEGAAVNVVLPPGTADAGWLRAFDAVAPSLLAAFRPQVLVTQCGADTHAEDPLADLRLSSCLIQGARRPSSPVGGAPGPSRWPDRALDICSPMRPTVSMTSSGLHLPVAETAELGRWGTRKP